jgi:hypothetical protein
VSRLSPIATRRLEQMLTAALENKRRGGLDAEIDVIALPF